MIKDPKTLLMSLINSSNKKQTIFLIHSVMRTTFSLNVKIQKKLVNNFVFKFISFFV